MRHGDCEIRIRMSRHRDDVVCVDGEASETDDEGEATTHRVPKIVQSSYYRDENCVDGEASETDDEEESEAAKPSGSTAKYNHLDVSGIKIIEKINDAPPEHPLVSTKWRAMVMAVDNQRVKNRRKQLIEVKKLEKQIDTRFAALQHSGRTIRSATDALLNIDALFEKLDKNCEEILKNRRDDS
ncbi:hypothetical protein PMAYCL1PPCAC_21407 [Pristionchus mayeri]|uniref:Biogenesis of lysosome-related organelles complex 1 subunit 3 n=1 Tax=Pristionchus mayeri TaxID=1317129 RepID=A0AAN5CV81_9BILA|nr:hypothetical protein PMAYCL1PPCAC_21407 [Pristionchus mayeri]